MLRIFHPEQFQAPKNLKSSKGYFEGWYYKTVASNGDAIAIIIGIALNQNEKIAFIQTINGKDGSTTYSSFNISEFSTTKKPFSISIGNNFFSKEKVIIGDRTEIRGKIEISDMKILPINIFRPGIMGWYRYLPKMECYHGVVSLRHKVNGFLSIGNKETKFVDSPGYIEKDWGTSFPEAYVWMQTNNFSNQNCSFMLSIAKIPWINRNFRGFLGFLNINQRIIIFSTYTSAILNILAVGEKKIKIEIKGKGFGLNKSLRSNEIIIIEASRKSVGSLAAPVTGSMKRRIGESIDGKISVKYFKNEKLLFDDIGIKSGLEIVGNMNQLK